MNLRLTEQAVLLEAAHKGRAARRKTAEAVIAAAVLMDLCIEGRLDTDSRMLHAVDRTATGDAMLDTTLAAVAERAESASPEQWIEWTRARAREVRAEALARLEAKGCVAIARTGLGVGRWRWLERERVKVSRPEEVGEIETIICAAARSKALPEAEALGIACLAASARWGGETVEQCAAQIEERRPLDRIGLALRWVLEER